MTQQLTLYFPDISSNKEKRLKTKNLSVSSANSHNVRPYSKFQISEMVLQFIFSETSTVIILKVM